MSADIFFPGSRRLMRIRLRNFSLNFRRQPTERRAKTAIKLKATTRLEPIKTYARNKYDS